MIGTLSSLASDFSPVVISVISWTRFCADAFDEPALALIARYVAVANRVTQAFWGDDSFDTTVDEIVASLRRREDEVSRRFLVTEGGGYRLDPQGVAPVS